MQPTDPPENAGDAGGHRYGLPEQAAGQPPYQPDYGAGAYGQQQSYPDPAAYPQQPAYQQPGYEQTYGAGVYPPQLPPEGGYGQAAYQQPGYAPGAYPPPPGPWQPGPGQPGGPGKSRRNLYLIVGAAVVVVALLVVGGIFLFGGGGSEGKKPEAVISEYLNDLAAGRADAALALGEPPASKTFLTAAILKQQQKQAKISNVKSLGTEYGNDGTHDRSRVHVTYRFGSQNADEFYTMTKTDGKWVLDRTTLSLSTSGYSDIPGLELYGVPLKGQQKIDVFPGPLKFSTSNPNLAVTNKSAAFATSPSDYAYPDLSTDLSSKGKQAVEKAVADAMQECAKSHSLAPENCPNHEFGSSGLPVQDSADWTAPTDYSGLTYRPGYDNPAEVRVSGEVVFKVSYKSKDFLSEKETTQTDEVRGILFGTVDLSTSPPTFSRS